MCLSLSIMTYHTTIGLMVFTLRRCNDSKGADTHSR